MIIYLLGAEQPTLVRLAKEADAAHLGLSFHSLVKRMPKTKPWLIEQRIGQPIYVASGGHTIGLLGPNEREEYVAAYENFVELNAAWIVIGTEIDAAGIDAVAHQSNMRSMLGDRFAPVWIESTGLSRLEELAQVAKTVAMRADTVRLNPLIGGKLAPLRQKYGTSWHVLDGARLEDLMLGRYQSACTIGWTSPAKYGETIVWDGTRMQRYNAKAKDQARKRHRMTFTRAGFDADAILADNHEELTKFTVWSYAQMESYLSKKPPTRNPFTVVEGGLSTSGPGEEPTESAELVPRDVDSTPVVVRNSPAVPTPRGARRVLPVMAHEVTQSVEMDADGNQVLVERLLAKNNNMPLLQCDTCYVAANCPAFQPSSECAFELPTEIRTKEQLMATYATVVEQQVQRVMFMRYQEQLNGGYADPNTSQEMDRLSKMLETLKDMKDNREYLRFQVEAKSAGGMLSAVFGEKARSLRNLDSPVEPGRVMNSIIEQ